LESPVLNPWPITSLKVFEQGVELGLCPVRLVTFLGRGAVPEIEMMTEVRRLTVFDELGVNLTTFIVYRRIVQFTVFAHVKIRSAMGADILPSDLHPDLHLKLQLGAALVAIMAHLLLLTAVPQRKAEYTFRPALLNSKNNGTVRTAQ
jgi:hypothetical protein